MQPLPKLPIGIQDFEKLRQNGCVYVDKTETIHRLITEGVAWFLSRPRRFGKSLLISTLAAIFRGRRDLFQGLWIGGSGYDWPAHPVIQLDMSRIASQNLDQLPFGLVRQFDEAATEHGLEPITPASGGVPDAPGILDELISRLAREKGKVVVLIDEYDKPILDRLADPEQALAMRDRLRDFYTILKAQDRNLRAVFLTGVSRFSKVSVFSGINHLEDISYAREYGAIVGITQAELESVFAAYLDDIAREEGISVPELLTRIRGWYNGYRFHPATESIYNPFSCLLYLRNREFKPWWFETGTPTFLIDLLRKSSLPVADLERKVVSRNAFSSFEVDRIDPLTLLQQTGYLTIVDYNQERKLYTLDYPNREVREAFLTHLAEDLSGRGSGSVTGDLWRLQDALATNDPDTFFEILASLFAGIPYDIQVNLERYYQSLFYLIFRLMGLYVRTEIRTATGRIDATVELPSGVWIFEFKLDGSADAALAQIQDKDYAAPYAAAGKPVYLVGVNFDSKRRNVGEWKMISLASG
uniref:PD-(D/E)XK nuclease superfamily protein n=1 Tax=Candidatus Kentrum sp. UNK TaxID=2126344 RepID=A0A451AY47_9GAMM|nr:MAG: PD-(D/E)XK nuclease superfamily protein [Candidatus Kentron sp. UNK]VFK70897.1 MAG: PD-(D/E)XK nuclease superfamily protein [Candidatus Kentron sp. UNK]